MSRKPIQSKLGAYPVQGKPAFLEPAAGKQLEIHSFALENRVGSAINVGILRRYGDDKWSFGVLTAASTPDYVNTTTAIQAGTATTLFASNNDGFLVQSAQPFALVGVNVTNTAGGGATFAYQYYNGSSYAALGAVLNTPDYTQLGSQLLLFAPPIDWVVGTTAAVGGNTALYSIRVISSTAPADTAIIDDLWVGELISFKDSLADNGVLSIDYPDDSPLVLDGEEGIMPFFGTADAGNLVTAMYSIRG